MTLVDAEANEEVGPLVRHSTINLADLGTDQLSAVLTWSGSPSVRSVGFYLDSATITTTENAAPYSLLTDYKKNRNRRYIPWTATPGTHTIVAELFNRKKLDGYLHIYVYINVYIFIGDLRTRSHYIRKKTEKI